MEGIDFSTITILAAIVGTGLALWRLIKHDIRDIRGDVREIRGEITGLRERMAKLEGLFQGFTEREPD